MSLDFWETGISIPDIGTELYSGMYYYLLDTNNKQNTSILGNCPAIHSVLWSPILDKTDLSVKQINYDVNRFGEINNNTLTYIPSVFRITSLLNTDKELKTLDIYKLPERVDTRSYKNESRLLNYPYSYATLNDYINTPMEVQYHQLPFLNNKFTVKSKAFISDKGTYSLYIENLKGDYYGNTECMINSSPLDVPVSSSAYANWSSTQKASEQQNYLNNLHNIGFNIGSSGAKALASGFTLNAEGVVNGLSGGIRGALDIAQTIGSREAFFKDLRNTPRTMLSTGSDIGFSMINGKRKIELLRYNITDEYKQRLGDYFALYGYKQSKLMTPNLRDRYYYNFIRTIGANVISKRRTIPKTHLNKLRNIFDNGVTIWHMDRVGVQMFDYTYDNREV